MPIAELTVYGEQVVFLLLTFFADLHAQELGSIRVDYLLPLTDEFHPVHCH